MLARRTFRESGSFLSVLVTLITVDGPAAGARITARSGETIQIGRVALIELGLPPDPHMSTRHFAIECHADGCVLRDLGSTNGTFVDGARVSEALLNDGDRIEAGASVFLARVDHRGLVPGEVVEQDAPPVVPLPEGTETDPGARTAALPRLPVFDLVNESGWALAMLVWEDAESRAALTVVIKGTFPIGGADLAPAQRPILGADQVRGEDPLSVRLETDMVPFKPRTDVVLVGRAYAPGDRPVTELIAGLRVGPLSYPVAVFGDRVWEWQSAGPPTISAPRPFAVMDLVYERAFGGVDGQAGLYCRENPRGTGFIGKLGRERVQDLRLPNVEDPRNPIRSWDTRPKPVGLGFYGRGWVPRLAYAGTYDDAYTRQRYPKPPADFSYRFFNGAHPDLQLEGYLRGDEDVELVNVCRGRAQIRFRLPGLMPRITVARWTISPERWVDSQADGGRLRADEPPLAVTDITPVLDTLVFIPDEGIFVEVFRGICRLASLESLEIARISVTAGGI